MSFFKKFEHYTSSVCKPIINFIRYVELSSHNENYFAYQTLNLSSLNQITDVSMIMPQLPLNLSSLNQITNVSMIMPQQLPLPRILEMSQAGG